MIFRGFVIVLLMKFSCALYTPNLSECTSDGKSDLSVLDKYGEMLNSSSVAAESNFCDLHQVLMHEVERLHVSGVQINGTCVLQTFYLYVCLETDHLMPYEAFCRSFVEKRADVVQVDHEAYPTRNIWIYGFISVTVISLCSLLGISVLPVIKKPIYNKILLYLISLSVGTLAGNAVFQLIPEGFDAYNHPETVWRSTVVCAGLYLFFLVENLLENLFKTKHTHATQTSCMSSDFRKNVKPDAPGSLQVAQGGASADALIHGDSHTPDAQYDSLDSEAVNVVIKVREDYHQNDTKQENHHHRSLFNVKNIKPIAWMITVADGLHNFIDGMAIGASFVVSPMQGFSTSLAIFCEEFPHELGDFAILLNAGMSIKQAAFFNFASACCCYLGLIVGIVIGQQIQSATWIFALAGGVFLYISLAGMLPEARSHSLSPSLINQPWLCFWLQNFGLLTGFLAMFLLTFFKDSLNFV